MAPSSPIRASPPQAAAQEAGLREGEVERVLLERQTGDERGDLTSVGDEAREREVEIADERAEHGLEAAERVRIGDAVSRDEEGVEIEEVAGQACVEREHGAARQEIRRAADPARAALDEKLAQGDPAGGELRLRARRERRREEAGRLRDERDLRRRAGQERERARDIGLEGERNRADPARGLDPRRAVGIGHGEREREIRDARLADVVAQDHEPAGDREPLDRDAGEALEPDALVRLLVVRLSARPRPAHHAQHGILERDLGQAHLAGEERPGREAEAHALDVGRERIDGVRRPLDAQALGRQRDVREHGERDRAVEGNAQAGALGDLLGDARAHGLGGHEDRDQERGTRRREGAEHECDAGRAQRSSQHPPSVGSLPWSAQLNRFAPGSPGAGRRIFRPRAVVHNRTTIPSWAVSQASSPVRASISAERWVRRMRRAAMPGSFCASVS